MKLVELDSTVEGWVEPICGFWSVVDTAEASGAGKTADRPLSCESVVVDMANGDGMSL